MLTSIKKLIDYKIAALDGEIGRVDDFYFDDQSWIVRYLVVDTANWITGKKVLVSPASFQSEPDEDLKIFSTGLTKEQIQRCPDMDTARPVSRQEELKLIHHYNWPMYWPPMPSAVDTFAEAAVTTEESRPEESRLRSARHVKKYQIESIDGTIGRVEDFIVDCLDWTIRYMIVDTNNWRPGGNVLIAVPWIGRISWEDSAVYVELDKEEISRDSPPYDLTQLVDRDYEEKLYNYYQREKYWESAT